MLYEFNIKGGSENKSLFNANAAQAALVQETNYLKDLNIHFLSNTLVSQLIKEVGQVCRELQP